MARPTPAAQAEAVVNLISQIQATDANRQMGVMDRDVPMSGAGGDYGGGSGYANSYILYTIDTNALWLEITNIFNGQVYLNLHNATNQVYEIWSRTDLAATSWDIEWEVWPVVGQEPTPFTVPQRGRTNLFLWARDWTGLDENDNGLPDWWE
jgi:hypothetical protein